MPHYRFQFAPQSGLNWDDVLQDVPGYDYRFLLNGRVHGTDGGNAISLENIRGILPIETPLPAGDNENVGCYEDRNHNELIFFNWNSTGEHGIYIFNLAKRQVRACFVHPLLNFQRHQPINGCAIYGNLLAFTDGFNPIRMLDKTKIGQLLADPAHYQDRMLNLIKSPPLLNVAVSATAQLPGPQKNLERKCWQFIYQYEYQDFARSTWSPISPVISNAYRENKDLDTITVDFGQDVLDLKTGGPGQRHFKEIRAVRIAVRGSQYEAFRIIARIKPSGSTLVTFRNDGHFPVVSLADTLKPYDFVPLRAAGLAGIDNRLVVGGLTNGYPAHAVQVTDVSLTETVVPVGQGHRMAFKPNSTVQLGISYQDAGGRWSGLYTPSELRQVLPAAFARDKATQASINFKLADQPPVWAVAAQLFRTETSNREFFMQGIAEGVSYLENFDTATDSGQYIRKQIGLSGVQDGANWITKKGNDGVGDTERTVRPEDNTSFIYGVNTPIYEGGLDANGRKMVMVRKDYNLFGQDLNLMQEEPIGRTASGQLIYYEGQDKPRKDATRQPIMEFVGTRDLGKTKYLALNIANWSSSSRRSAKETYPNNEQFYQFQEGDRVDILYAPDGTYLGLLNLKVSGYFQQQLIVPITADLVPQSITQYGTGLFFEVYRPRILSETPQFYEFGETVAILHPGTGQRAYQRTSFNITSGDVHRIKKQLFANNYATPEDFYIYSMHPDASKTFERWERGQGKSHVPLPDPDRETTVATQITFSNMFMDEGILNGLSSFDGYAASHTYPLEYGPLRLLVPAQNQQVQNVGNIIMAQFQNETVSIYINRTTLQDLSGNSQVLKSDQVLGSYNTLLGSYGLQHPTSSVGVDSRRYWWDDYKGTPVRYSRDGLTPINHKMKTFFRKIKRQLAGTDYQVLGGYDLYHQQYMLTFRQGPRQGVTLAWNEDANRWESFYSFVPERYGSLGRELVSFVQGKLYLHHAAPDDEFNFFYDEWVKTRLDIVANELPSENKVFEAVGMESWDKWHLPLIQGHPRGANLEPQISRLLPNKVVEAEHIYRASILRDTSQEQKILEGKQMRGVTLQLQLELDGQVKTLTNLYAVNVAFALSNPNTLKK